MEGQEPRRGGSGGGRWEVEDLKHGRVAPRLVVEDSHHTLQLVFEKHQRLALIPIYAVP